MSDETSIPRDTEGNPPPTAAERDQIRWEQLRDATIELNERVARLERISADKSELDPAALETIQINIPAPIDYLIKWIESKFDCRDGEYRSHTEHEGKQIPYQILAFVTGSHGDPAQRLRNALHSQFVILLTPLPPKHVLYWRFAKECRIQEEVDFDTGLYRIYTRIAIPDANWSLVSVTKEGGSYLRV